MDKNNLKRNRHTNIYYEVNSDLQTCFEEYIILDTMRRYSKHNCYSEGVTFLSSYLLWSRGTIYKYLKSLIAKEHLSEENGNYYLHHDLKDRFTTNSINSNYIKLFHEIRKELELTIYEYSLFYLFYSYSRNSKKPNKQVNISCRKYLENLPITEREYYKIKQKLNTQGLIELVKGNIVAITEKGNTLLCPQSSG